MHFQKLYELIESNQHTTKDGYKCNMIEAFMIRSLSDSWTHSDELLKEAVETLRFVPVLRIFIELLGDLAKSSPTKVRQLLRLTQHIVAIQDLYFNKENVWYVFLHYMQGAKQITDPSSSIMAFASAFRKIKHIDSIMKLIELLAEQSKIGAAEYYFVANRIKLDVVVDDRNLSLLAYVDLIFNSPDFVEQAVKLLKGRFDNELDSGVGDYATFRSERLQELIQKNYEKDPAEENSISSKKVR